MFTPTGGLLFSGADYGCSPMHAIDSDETLRSLLGFLTLRPGDTDAEYFKDYTQDQLDFCSGDAESLSIWAESAASSGDSTVEELQFTDLEID
jgi:hypothetical protein